MEDFESPSIDSGSELSTWWEKSPEKSEKQKESYKKAQAQIQRSQKDEKKAKWDNEHLFHILERFIQNPYYEELIPLVTELLHKTVPARYSLSMIALFYPEATIHLLTTIGKPKDIDLLLSIHRETEMTQFDESSLHPTIRTWMSSWVQSSQQYLVQDDMSIILRQKLLVLLESDSFLRDALSDGICFFLQSRNIHTPKRIANSYADHINWEYTIAIQKSLMWDNEWLLVDISVDDHTLFWLVGHPDSRS